MRKNNKYLEKVHAELDVYARYLLDDEVELTVAQQDTFLKLEDYREWLLAGYSDSAVLTRSHRIHKLQERRRRELLAMTYELFRELRRAKTLEGVKYLEAEVLDEAAMEVRKEATRILNYGIVDEEGDELPMSPKNKEAVMAYVELMKLWKSLKKDAAQIKGALEKEVVARDTHTKPNVFNFVQVNSVADKKALDSIIDITHEEE